MAEAVRFELTEHFCSSVFKTGAINRTLPHFHFLAGVIGFEPMMTISKTVALDQLGDTPRVLCFKSLRDFSTYPSRLSSQDPNLFPIKPEFSLLGVER